MYKPINSKKTQLENKSKTEVYLMAINCIGRCSWFRPKKSLLFGLSCFKFVQYSNMWSVLLFWHIYIKVSPRVKSQNYRENWYLWSFLIILISFYITNPRFNWREIYRQKLYVWSFLIILTLYFNPQLENHTSHVWKLQRKHIPR